MRGPLVEEAVREAWRKAREAKDAAPDSAAVLGVLGHFALRYKEQLRLAHEITEVEQQVIKLTTRLVKVGPAAGEVVAGLILSRDGSKLHEALKVLRAAAEHRPTDGRVAVRLAVALTGASADKAGAFEAFRPFVTPAQRSDLHDQPPNTMLLALFGYLAATGRLPDEAQKFVQPSFERCIRGGQGGQAAASRGAVVCAIFNASMNGGGVPFEACEKIFSLERNFLFAPSNCQARLEMAMLLHGLKRPDFASRGDEMLADFAAECPSSAVPLSGMGQHWIDSTDSEAGKLGLGGDPTALAEIRRGIRRVQFAALDSSLRNATRGEAAEVPVEQETSAHLQALHAADIINSTLAASPAARQCLKQPLPKLARPPLKEKAGCPEVEPKHFKKRCWKKHRPCIVRGHGAEFLQGPADSLDSLDRWVELAPDTLVAVAFPFPPEASNGNGSLTTNSIRATGSFYDRPDVRQALERLGHEAADPALHPWTLIRPPHWSMRLRDAVSWLRYHPQPMYMKQVMVADLGGDAIRQLKTPEWVARMGFKLLSPSLWLSSGVVATGYHQDGPENLLVQLAGEKEVVLLRPPETRNLYYMPVSDVQAGFAYDDRGGGSVQATGLHAANHTTSGHSVVDLADVAQARRFPRYNQASGVSCHIKAGDVLYIPSFWHHAVLTVPDKDCAGFSLNLWYVVDGKPSSLEEAVKRWGGTVADITPGPRDWM